MNIQWAIRKADPAGLDAIAAAGFAAVQLPVAAVMDLDEGAFRIASAQWLRTGLSFKLFEAPLPPGVQVTEPGFNIYSWTEYLNTAMQRIASLGCTVLAWGDGRSRLLPVEGEVATHRENFHQFVFILCGIAERFGLTVCLEPLGPRRCNLLNSLSETADCIARVAKPNLAMLASPRDLHEMHEPATELLHYRHLVAHVHLENPLHMQQSRPPQAGDGADYQPFLKVLRDMDYAGVITLPAATTAEALRYCRSLLATIEGNPAAS